MSLHDETKMKENASFGELTDSDDIEQFDDLTEFERFCEWIKGWIKMNRKAAVVIGAAMLVYTIVFFGALATIVSNRANHVQNELEQAPISQAVAEPAPSPLPPLDYDVPVHAIDEAAAEPVPSPLPPSDYDVSVHAIDEAAAEPAYSAAHEIGMQTGAIISDSVDAVVDFWYGFDEATGVSGRARDIWDSGRERIGAWIEENLQPHDYNDTDIDTEAD